MRLCRKCGAIQMRYGECTEKTHIKYLNIDRIGEEESIRQEIKEIGWSEIVWKYHPNMIWSIDKKRSREKFSRYKEIYTKMKLEEEGLI